MKQSVVIVALAVKVLAVFFALEVMLSLLQWGSYLVWEADFQAQDTGSLFILGTETAIFILFIVLMWRFPFAIARRLVPESDGDRRLGDATVGEIQIATLSVVGLVMVAYALTQVSYWVAFWLAAANLARQQGISAGDLFEIDHIAALTGDAAMLLAGLWLAFGARGLVNMVRHARQAGHAE